MIKKTINFILLAFLLACMGAGCAPYHKPASQTRKPPVSYNTGTVTRLPGTPASPSPATQSAAPAADDLSNIDVQGEAPSDGEAAPLDEALELCQLSQDLWKKGQLDNAVQTLDQAYAILLSEEDAESDPSLLQQKEDIRFLISKRILEIYTSRTTMVNGAHNAIPIIINSEVQKEIDRFTIGPEREFFIASYQRSGKYRPFILKRLKEAGLPAELSWLPLIESGFKTKALSSARALGLWQFIPSTGYKFGLERDLYIDQRLDPERATDAAIQYLSALHRIFGDWATALAAYNCGEGKVLQVIRNQQVNYLDNFWDLYHRLPQETARYVPRFLATLHIVSNLEKYGMDTVAFESPVKYDTATICRQVNLKTIAETTGIPCDLLTELNPELRQEVLPPNPYSLRIPKGKQELVLAQIAALPIASLAPPPAPKPQVVYHKVRRGETLSTIAAHYRTTVSTLVKTNNIRKQNQIVVGRVLKIPSSGKAVAAATTTKTQKMEKPVQRTATMHKVRSGETLSILANRYGTTVKEIQQANKMSGTGLRVGQMLNIPGAGSSQKTAAKTYTVRPGDSPLAIAQSHNMPLNRFLQLNNLSSRSTIFPGQEVCVE